MKTLYKKDNKIAFLIMPDDKKNDWMKLVADESFF
jgi:hypothetical protein